MSAATAAAWSASLPRTRWTRPWLWSWTLQGPQPKFGKYELKRAKYKAHSADNGVHVGDKVLLANRGRSLRTSGGGLRSCLKRRQPA